MLTKRGTEKLAARQRNHTLSCPIEPRASLALVLASGCGAFFQVRKKLIRRGTKKLPPGSFRWWEDMEIRAKSGWLSREQLAASEFAKRVAIKHGIGVVASGMKKKEQVGLCPPARRFVGCSGAVGGRFPHDAAGVKGDNLARDPGIDLGWYLGDLGTRYLRWSGYASAIRPGFEFH